MRNILTLNKISPAGLGQLDPQKFTYGDDIENPDAIMVRSAAMHEMEFGDKLSAIARAGAGTNNIPVDRCSQEGIVVFNTPGANANAVKELVIFGLLMSARKIHPAMEWVQTLKGEGDAVPKLVEKGKGKFAGPELIGKKLGVIGLGAIGIMVANLARSLGMEVLGYDPYLSVDAAWGLDSHVIHAKTLQEVYEQSDFITLHVPLVADTKGMINSQSIQMMKNRVRILNFARGELVNTEDMLAALEERDVGCYITDFPTDALLDHPGVLAIPHLGASTPESEDNCAKMAAKQLSDFLRNGNIVNSVNFPNISAPRCGDVRLGIVHKNIPAMIAGISNAVSNVGNNIENLSNKSKKDYAYTIVDISGHIDADLIKTIESINGVLRVNVYH